MELEEDRNNLSDATSGISNNNSDHLQIINYCNANTDQLLELDYALSLNDREFIITGNKKLKKLTLNNDQTQFNCVYTIELPEQRPGFAILRKISDNCFLMFEPELREFPIFNADTGDILHTIQFPYINESQFCIDDVKYLTGTIIIAYDVQSVHQEDWATSEPKLDMCLYSWDEKKFIAANICQKKFDCSAGKELKVISLCNQTDIFDPFDSAIIQNNSISPNMSHRDNTNIKNNSIPPRRFGDESHFVTLYRHDDKSRLSLWKLTLHNGKPKGKYTLLSTIEKTLSSEENNGFVEMVESTDDCFLVRWGKSVDLYKLIDKKIVLIKHIKGIFDGGIAQDRAERGMFNSWTIIPLNKFCVFLVREQTDILKTPKEAKYNVCLRNLVNNTSEPIVEFNSIQYGTNEEWHIKYKFLFLKQSSTLIFYPNCAKPFVKFNLDKQMMFLVYYADLQMYTKLLAQAYRTNSSLFPMLPIELTNLIICKTKDYQLSKSDLATLESIVYKMFSQTQLLSDAYSISNES